jgi:hypothetical protein
MLIAKRDSVLYVRISTENKEFIKKEAAKSKATLSIFMDYMISEFRKDNAKKNNTRKKK